MLHKYNLYLTATVYKNSKHEDKVYQLFGHVHSGKYTNNALNKGLDYERLKMLFPTQYDVGVDNNDFTPISWYDVNNKIQEQIKNNKNQYL
jgi:calcineurin-like phosphoesterase family protein